jgi:hypothetical protein
MRNEDPSKIIKLYFELKNLFFYFIYEDIITGYKVKMICFTNV